ncbi:MAG TPA: nitrate reductase molybdenum cofactor assembly chaperone [Methylotenera sp.]|nr:nitrate reductase molybdenum cofactor assembly chaperone [Methylotenera sp.]
MKIYKLLSVLLEYPDQELIDHIQELREFLPQLDADNIERDALQVFINHMQSMSLTELQADYVKTFDMVPEHSLHLTHHLFGDDKNRGPALIDLGELYKDYGVEVVTNELPDYLPLILEFTAQLDDSEATVFLADAKKVLAVLTENLTKVESPYAALLSIIENRATLSKLAA